MSIFLGVVCCVLVWSTEATESREKRSISLFPLNAESSAFVLRHALPKVDFPVLPGIPLTSFSCGRANIFPNTYAADPETGCQVFHKCDLTKRISGSFLCPNYTIFNDQTQVCEWFHSVDCARRAVSVVSVPAPAVVTIPLVQTTRIGGGILNNQPVSAGWNAQAPVALAAPVRTYPAAVQPFLAQSIPAPLPASVVQTPNIGSGILNTQSTSSGWNSQNQPFAQTIPLTRTSGFNQAYPTGYYQNPQLFYTGFPNALRYV